MKLRYKTGIREINYHFYFKIRLNPRKIFIKLIYNGKYGTFNRSIVLNSHYIHQLKTFSSQFVFEIPHFPLSIQSHISHEIKIHKIKNQ